VLNYQIEFKKSADAVFEIYKTSYTSTSITVTNLTPGVTYMF
jgi:hypothetical protein